MTEIRLSNDFSKFPGGRYVSDGPFSGEKFREEFLVPALKKQGDVTIDLDGAMGLPTSFLEEAFGGLVRKGFDKDELLSRIKLSVSEERLERYPSVIIRYISEAS